MLKKFLLVTTTFILAMEGAIYAEKDYTQSQIEEVYSQALYYVNSGDYQKALDNFRLVLKYQPQNKTARDYVDILSLFIKWDLLSKEKKEITGYRTFIEDLYLDALYSISVGDTRKAQKELFLILEYEPQNEKAKAYLREIAAKIVPQKKITQEKKTYQKPIPREEALKKVISQKRSEAYRLYRQALILYNDNKASLASQKLEEALRFSPSYEDASLLLAKIKLDEFKKYETLRKREERLEYTLGPEDVLSINVLNHPELSGKVMVEPGGEIILPLVKEVIKAKGLTKEELAKNIREVLSKYVKQPQVSVVITGYNSKKWYILGEVARPGEYPMGKTKLTLMEALYRAGLIRENRAAVGRVVVIKPHKENPQYQVINVAQILYKGVFKDNIDIEPGTIIYVPKTVLTKFSDVIGVISSPLASTRSSLEDLVSTSTAARAATPIKDLIGPTPKK